MNEPKHGVVEGEMFGFPVPGQWPGNAPQPDDPEQEKAAAINPPPKSSWFRRIFRRSEQ